MNTIQSILKFLQNKYFLATVFFLCWIFFFAQNDVITQYNENKELKEMKAKMSYLQSEIVEMKKERDSLSNSYTAIEKYARENYLMHKPGEEIFVFDTTKTIEPASK